MDIRWNLLVIVTPLLSYSTFVLCTGLIVEDLEVNEYAILAQTSHDGLVSLQAMLVLVSLEWDYQNCVRVAIIGNSEILVAALRLDRLASCAISI